MKRFIVNERLTLFGCWLSSCYSCVKWDNAWSEPFHLSFGVRQGSVSSPYMFALLLKWFNSDMTLCSGCWCNSLCRWHSANSAFSLWSWCFSQNVWGPRNNASCLPVSLSAGTVISWVNEMRYLGIFIMRSRKFKCSLEHAKSHFIRQWMQYFHR